VRIRAQHAYRILLAPHYICHLWYIWFCCIIFWRLVKSTFFGRNIFTMKFKFIYPLVYTPLVVGLFVLTLLANINQLLNLQSLNFSSVSFGWLRCITLTSTFYVISWGNIVLIMPTFSGTKLGSKTMTFCI
jgi:hypothetical protein